MRNKRSYTEELLKKSSFKDDFTVDELFSIIWRNIRPDGGFRLTHGGHYFFTQYLELENYTIRTTANLTVKLLLDLDRKLQHPYYLDINKGRTDIVLFDSKEAMLANLYGDIQKFLDNYS